VDHAYSEEQMKQAPVMQNAYSAMLPVMEQTRQNHTLNISEAFSNSNAKESVSEQLEDESDCAMKQFGKYTFALRIAITLDLVARVHLLREGVDGRGGSLRFMRGSLTFNPLSEEMKKEEENA